MDAGAKRSDLPTRVASAIVMVAVAGTALALGGRAFTVFVVAVGLGVLWEFWGLAQRIAKTPLGAAVWLMAGVSYIGTAMAMLIQLRQFHIFYAVMPIVAVIAVDVGAYFAGRSLGGPKIAPKISPSKTWAGLIGGMVAAAAIIITTNQFIPWQAPFIQPDQLHDSYYVIQPWWTKFAVAGLTGIFIAIVAQSGDFFESWMKRRAGVKDSGHLIPGHGGLFDRVDGLLAVLFVGAVLYLLARIVLPA